MEQQQFIVKNVKCNGCIDTIKRGLSDVSGVQEVEATPKGGVTVRGQSLQRAALSRKLTELGYPEAEA